MNNKKEDKIRFLEESLKFQERQGNPKFKKRIARALHSNFDLEMEKSMEIVFSKEVQQKIDQDIEWSQHMGSEFWAKEIYEEYVLTGEKMHN